MSFGDILVGSAWPSIRSLTVTSPAEREGQYSSPVRIVALNLAEGWSRDVSEEIAKIIDYKCSDHIAVSDDQWPDDVRLPDLESRFVCKACGKRGADVRPNFSEGKKFLGY
jgi:hypothetical protein